MAWLSSMKSARVVVREKGAVAPKAVVEKTASDVRWWGAVLTSITPETVRAFPWRSRLLCSPKAFQGC
jgi:hypothetical protein